MFIMKCITDLIKNKIAQGDSGGPVWQYQMGRAVIVGVYSSNEGDDFLDCSTASDYYNNLAIFVDQAIDWIKNVTQLN